jgi:hypothetical protein
MILNPPVLVDDIYFEKLQKVEKYLIEKGVKILKTITGTFFIIILN